MGNANMGTDVDEHALGLLDILKQMPLLRKFDVNP